MKTITCVIIGAGHTGLYLAKQLQDRGLSYQVLEAGNIAQAWRNRMPGMNLFTSRQFSSLPDFPMAGDQNITPTVSDMVNYLSSYATIHHLTVRENTEVLACEKRAALFHLRLSNGETLQAQTVVNATGSNQVPLIPAIAKSISPHIIQLTADHFDVTTIKTNAKVLIVGDGASGRYAAKLLANTHEVTLSCAGKSGRNLVPGTVLGRNVFWWLNSVKVLFADKKTLIGRLMAKRNPVPMNHASNTVLRTMGVSCLDRLMTIEDKHFFFASGESIQPDVVVWATGYKDNTSWLLINEAVVEQQFAQQYGITPVKGLYTVGRKWLSCRASELIMGVEKDVGLIVPSLIEYLQEYARSHITKKRQEEVS